MNSRPLHAAVVRRMGMIIAFGLVSPAALAQCGSWTFVIQGPGQGSDHPAVFDSWRRYVVIPNAVFQQPAIFDTWSWNGSKWSFETSTGPSSRGSFPIAFDSARGVIVLHGGKDAEGDNEDTWEFDGAKWTEVDYGGVSPREDHTMTYHPAQDRTYLFGGVLSEDFKDTFYDTTYEWNGYIKDWKPVLSTPKPAKRADHVMAYDSWRGVSVMYGGFGTPFPGGTLVEHIDTWEWDGSAWHERLKDSPPQVRRDAAMVFDSRRGVALLWGGVSGSRTNEMWEWDGQAWTLVDQGPVVPEARSSHAMAYDEFRGVIVLFGGSTNSGSLSDTWEYTPCVPDCERDCDLDVFDYLCFLDKFAEGSPYCDFERDGDNDLFDFLKFQDEFVKGCG